MNISYPNFKQQFEVKLEDYLDGKTKSFKERYENELIEDLLSQIKTLALAEAKRIRPFVAYLMYMETSDESSTKSSWSPYLAIELFHLFGLVHDDIIDRDSLRRGEQTIHKYISECNFSQLEDGEHIGESLAMLSGDLIYSWVSELFFLAEGYSQQNKTKAKEKFFNMGEEVLVGQIMDMDKREGKDMDYLVKKMSLKTASYTFIRPMQIGTALAGGGESRLNFCKRWGQKMGLAFQIQDNLIDLTSDQTGKDDFSDIKEGCSNILIHFVKQQRHEEYEDILKPNLGADEISDTQKEEIKKLFESSGAVDYARDQVEEYLNQAKHILKKSHLSSTTKQELHRLIKLLEDRKK
ncbi:MAG: polyprenyl synthetase family protein [Candidatus Paceibacteria bacterium]